MTLTRARTIQYIGILCSLGIIAVGYWYFSVRAGVKTNTGALQAPGADTLALGLAGYWKLDDASGTTATDSSVNGNNGTLTNGPTWTTGQINSAVDFDGVNDYVATSTTLTSVAAITVSAWVKADSAIDGMPIIGHINGQHGSDHQCLYFDNAGTDSLTFGGGGATLITVTLGSGVLGTTNWHHITYTNSGSTNKMFLDGNLVGENTTGALTTANEDTIAIGQCVTGGGTTYFDGKIDEARIYNRALSSDEISNLYRLTSPTGVDTSLKGYWSFNSDALSGTTAYDWSGAMNNGTLTNGPGIVEGQVGQALFFDGIDDYVVGTATATSNTFSYSAWIKPSTNGGTIIGTTSNGIQWRLDGGALNLVAAGSSNIGYSVQTVPIGIWTYVAITNDASGNYTFYINGHDAGGSGTNAYNYDNQRPAIGSRYHDNPSELFTGAIDEVRIYNRALTATEIKSLYDRGTPDKANTSALQPQGAGRLDSGLAGYWKLDDASGTTATDSSTNGNNGTLTNGPTWTTGQIKGAADFDGSNDYITTSTSATVDLDTRHSVSAWFNPDTLPSDGTYKQIVAEGAASCCGIEYGLALSKAGGVDFVQLNHEASGTTLTYETTLPTGIWYHLAGTWDGVTMRLYLNGAEVSSQSQSGTISEFNDIVTIGSGEGVGYFDGKIDEVRIYNRALSSDEISNLYRLTSPTGVDTSLKGYWSFNGSDISGTTTYDRSGAGNTGTLTNSPTIAEGISGQAIRFDGSDDYITVSNSSALNPTAQITVSTWVKRVGTGTRQFIISKGNATSEVNTQYWLEFTSGNSIVFELDSGSTQHTLTSSFTLADTSGWHYIVGTYDGTNQKLYVDGIQDSSTLTWSGSINTTIADLALGNRSGFYNIPFSGLIDESRIYNRALSVAEIKAQYDVAAPDKTNTSTTQPQGTGRLDSGLAGYWKFDETTGSSAADASTNGNTGTLTNMENGDWVTGQIGNGLDFDGTNEYVAASATPFTGHSSGTITAWIKSTNGGATQTIFGASTLASGNYTGYFYTSSGGKLAMRFKGNGSDLVSCGVTDFGATAQVAASGTWTFVAITNDATGKKFYKNATLQGNDCGSDTTWFDDLSVQPPVDASIGSWLVSGGPTTFFLGSIDEVRVYDHALSSDEIGNLYRTTTPTAVDTGLKGYWSFNGSDISGTTAYDRSGAGNNGALTNSPAITEGKIGQALVFDGVDDVVSATCPSSISNGTIAFWAKTTGSGGTGNKHPFDIRDDGGNSVIAFRTGVTDDIFIRNAAGTSAQLTAMDYSLDGAWHHYAATVDGTNLTGFKDGVSVGNVAWASSLTGIDTCYIGDGPASDKFPGSIDEVRLYNRALSAGEIKALYSSGK